MTKLTPDRARLLGRAGGYTTAARHDSKETTRRARDAFLARFEREVDPESKLPADERTRRATALRRAYFAKLGAASAEARRRRAA